MTDGCLLNVCFGKIVVNSNVLHVPSGNDAKMMMTIMTVNDG